MNDNWVLLAGLTDHEAAAIEIMVNMTWRDQRCITLRRDLSLSIPEQTAQAKACRYCVIDLFSLGLRKHSPDNEVLLLQFLAGRSAVLLVRGSGSGWFDALLPLQPGQHITCLSMPYSSIALREALQKIKNANAADAQRMPAAAQPSAQQPASDAAPASSAASAEPAAPSVTAASAAGKPALSAPSPAPPAPAPAPMPAWRRALQLAERLHAERSARNTQSLHSKRQPAAAPQPAPPPAHEPIAPTASQPAAHRPASRPASRPGSSARPPARSIAALPSLQAEAPESLSVAPPAVPLTAQALGLRTGAWAKLLRALPALKDVALADFIGQTLQGTLGEGLQLWRIGPVVCLVHVRQGWLATVAPPATLQKMVHTTGLLQSVERHPLPAEQLHSAAQKFFGQNFQRLQKPLDVLAWDLLSESLDGLTLRAQDDFTLQLRCFPNFPHLTRSDPLDVQLAAICARIPQSVHDLLRAFPRHEQAVLRFVALSVACGLAVVLEDAPAAAQEPSAPGPDQAAAAKPPAPASPAAAPAPASGAAKARRGFFKSLLDKLF